MQTVTVSRARRLSQSEIRRAIETPSERTPFYANRSARESHEQADARFIVHVAARGTKRIQWEHASFSQPRQVAPYQRRTDFIARMPRTPRRIVVRGVEYAEAIPTETLDSNALAMVREATQASREAQAQQAKLKALFDLHRRANNVKPDGHVKHCACHRCKIASA